MAELRISLPTPVSGRLPVLDELKGVAILLVILYHGGGVLGWRNTLHFDLGVDIFVVLSGIGLALSSRYRGPGEFMARRLSRIMPAYWIVLTIYALGSISLLQRPTTATDLILHYLGVHAWFGDAHAVSINDSFWYITLILTLYGLFCLVRPLLEHPARLLLAGSVISVTIALGLFYWNQPAAFGFLGLRIPGFFVGLLIGQLLKTGRLSLPVGAALGAALFVFVYVPYTQGIVFHPTVAGLALMGIYALTIRPALPPGAQGATGRVLKFLGDHSLEIFLIHQPLIRDYNVYLLGRWFNIIQPGRWTLLVGMVIGLAVTLVASVELRRMLQKVPFLSKA